MRKAKKMSLKSKDRLLTASSVIVTVAPLITVLGINFNEYFVKRAGGVSVAFGGVLALILIVLLSKDKLTVFKGVWGYLIVFLLAVFLKPIIDDIVLLTGVALTGKTADSLVVQIPLKKVRRARAAAENAALDADSNDYRATLLAELKKLTGGKQ